FFNLVQQSSSQATPPSVDNLKSEPEQGPKTSWTLSLLLLSIVVAVCLGLYLQNSATIKSGLPTESSQSSTQFLDIRDQAEALVSQLLQTPEFNQSIPAKGRNVLRNVLQKSLDQADPSPAVLLLVGSSGQAELLHAISHQIAILRNGTMTSTDTDYWPGSV